MKADNYSLKNILKSSALNPSESLVLLAFILKKKREFLLSNPNKNLRQKTIDKFKVLEKKRLNGVPLAYLLNKQSFYKSSFWVDERVLIPRPETEIMLDLALLEILKLDQGFGSKKPFINLADIGTGSAAIIISLTKELLLKNKSLYKNTSFYALDISNDALNIARKNIKKHKLDKKIEVLTSDLLNNLPKTFWQVENIFLLANLPYLKQEEIDHEFSLKYEPRIALDGQGFLGILIYQNLLSQLKSKNFQNLNLYCEINPEQAGKLKIFTKNLFSEEFYNLSLFLKKDLRKKNRFLIIKIKKRLK